MPHPNNLNWIQHVVSHPDQARPVTLVAEIPARREFFDLGVLNVDLPTSVAVHEDALLRERDGVPLTAEIYVPEGDGPFPAFLYLHGGFFCVWSAAHLRKVAMRIAEQGFVVVNLEYGLAPEHPFPWAVEDAVYAARWITKNIDQYNGDASTVGIGGDSCGANLSAAAIIALDSEEELVDPGDLGGVPVNIGGALFLYGLFSYSLLMERPGSQLGPAEIMGNLAYLGPTFLSQHKNPLVSPILAPRPSNFPQSYFAVGDEDSLLPHSLAMVDKLASANVPTTLSVVAGMDHAFLMLEHLFVEAREEMERIARWLRRTFLIESPAAV
jgi:acetyl esterase